MLRKRRLRLFFVVDDYGREMNLTIISNHLLLVYAHRQSYAHRWLGSVPWKKIPFQSPARDLPKSDEYLENANDKASIYCQTRCVGV